MHLPFIHTAIKKALATICAIFLCVGNLTPLLIAEAAYIDTYTPVKVYPINYTSATSIQDEGFEVNQAMFATSFTTSADITTLQSIFETGGSGNGIFIAINAGNLEVYIGNGNDLELTTPILASTKYTILLFADKTNDLLELYISTTATSTADIDFDNSTKIFQTGWTDPDWDGGNDMGVYLSASSVQGGFTGTNAFLGTPHEGVSVYNGEVPFFISEGCIDPIAVNYSSSANTSDGSCLYRPVITLNGDSPLSIGLDSTYVEYGATASDSEDGNITGDIVITNSVNTAISGTYTVEYDVSDSAGNYASTEVRTVHVGTSHINQAPIIQSYNGSLLHTLNIGEGITDVGKVSAVDSINNIVGEYGTSTLTGNTWETIDTYEMCSPVVNVSHRQDVSGEIQRAPRVRNKTSTDFEVNVDNYLSTIGTISTDIDYLVMNAGYHTFAGGLVIDAGSINTSVVSCNGASSPTPTPVVFPANFILPPVVTHTVSTHNDPTWVVSGVNGNNSDKGSEPLIGGLGIVLQRSFNSCVHDPEDVDYIAIEPGTYTLLDGTVMDAVRSTDSIAAITTTGNPIDFGTAFSSAPKVALVSQLGEDGGNGSYAQIHTGSGVTNTQVFATVDEDGPSADRSHTNEVVSSVAFDKESGQFWEENIITYTITGGADSTDFTLNSTTGKLDFITGKSPSNYTDANDDGIYEVEVSACDSHCNSACSTQTILADVSDATSPTISGMNFTSETVLPGGNHDMIFNYSDNVGGTGIDISTANVTLQKWNGTAYGVDISSSGFGTESITATSAIFPTNNLGYGKYKTTFTIDDIAGNSSTVYESIFYIDTPSIIITHESIDLGLLNPLSSTFSSGMNIQVKTIGVPYKVYMNTTVLMKYSTHTLSFYDGSYGVGYDRNNNSTIDKINTDEVVIFSAGNINTNGQLNSNTYPISFGGIHSGDQIAGDYEGEVSFRIEYDY